MQPFSIPVLPPTTRIRPRTAVVASADHSFRQRLSEILTGLRWQVREAEGGPKPGLKPRPPLRRRSSSTPGCPISKWPSSSRTSGAAFPRLIW
jgi:hypothetical protein